MAGLAWLRRLWWARLPAAGGWAGLGQVGLAWLGRLGWGYEHFENMGLNFDLKNRSDFVRPRFSINFVSGILGFTASQQ